MLVNTRQAPGDCVVTFNAQELASGKFRTDEVADARKIAEESKISVIQKSFISSLFETICNIRSRETT